MLNATLSSNTAQDLPPGFGSLQIPCRQAYLAWVCEIFGVLGCLGVLEVVKVMACLLLQDTAHPLTLRGARQPIHPYPCLHPYLQGAQAPHRSCAWVWGFGAPLAPQHSILGTGLVHPPNPTQHSNNKGSVAFIPRHFLPLSGTKWPQVLLDTGSRTDQGPRLQRLQRRDMPSSIRGDGFFSGHRNRKHHYKTGETSPRTVCV